MKYIILILTIFFAFNAGAQIDSSLLRRTPVNTAGNMLNMDAVYNRPFLSVGKLPVALGGYA